MGVYDRLRMTLRLRAQAFGPLANVEWTIPPGVSAVVGPNRAGKSTLLALPEFIRIAMGESVNDAVKRVFDGPAYLRTFGLPSASSCRVGAAWQSRDRWAWEIEISIAAGAIAPYCAERLEFGNEAVLTTGLFTALLQLCAVASITQTGLVTIDELETSLHPHAIRVLIAAFRRWAKEHDLRIVLATQSETVLGQFHDNPENVFVIEPNQPTTPVADRVVRRQLPQPVLTRRSVQPPRVRQQPRPRKNSLIWGTPRRAQARLCDRDRGHGAVQR